MEDQMRQKLVAVTKRMLARALARAERAERNAADLDAEIKASFNAVRRRDCEIALREQEQAAGAAVAEALHLEMELARMGVEL